ncbi:[Glutamate--ammonia-ligase] adenylyltransferase [Saliniradius amylolyticus]|uniref:Bifunctional glutamine synthetase adenylyltransferase/adenylyl-removing enzyme n=1 Tax=Saliniradius amylolyticus TaxID=2183582 RepID=A0A2S2E7A3_9ALTE|nr:bifunctional [glutamate--ammonia ligase]-adenylyl-L-tyrosine phosphorylase/[glutamate--ammonia-ligase] adenylyltransferase [Saliniradius amylolyticus]AWL12847.1 [Glutamate--ammonia-ligase] adenylyltransferase [Saliniradius amylolyticus]
MSQNHALPPPLAKTADKYWQRLREQDTAPEELEKHQTWLWPVLGLSDFVCRALTQYPQWINWLANERHTAVRYREHLKAQLQEVTSEDELMPVLRRYRQQQMLRLAVLDLRNEQDIDTSLKQVSELADALINEAYQWLYHKLGERFGTPMYEGQAQPMLILGMGKLGGHELNFSSDIDLIFCYPELGETEGGKKCIENQVFFTKLGQKLINALNQITVDGQVFRVDMRLRPFGDSGPLVMHFAALEDYYQEQGREWERYAMVKARVINPDKVYAAQLQQILRPFVYRRYIDYSAIDALRNMKRLIRKEVRRRSLTDNIKLGAGGIREVEFIAQTFQLIRGGREQALQTPNLYQVLAALRELEVLPEQELTDLETDYRFLRKVEHCLQQFDDQQTQALPEDEHDQARLAWVMEEESYDQLYRRIGDAMERIHDYFNGLIGEDEEHQEPEAHSDWQDLWELSLTDEEALALLSQNLSEAVAEELWQQLKTFATEQEQRSMGKRGRETLDKLMPLLLQLTFENQPEHSGELLGRLLMVVQAVSRRTTYLELLRENKGALEQLIRLCHASPWIAEQIRSFPILLDELLNPQQLYELNQPGEYEDELRRYMLRIPEDDLEAQMEALRQFKLSQQLKVAAADVTGVLPVMRVSDHLTNLAEAVVREVVHLAWLQMEQKYGRPQGIEPTETGLGVIAYGKMGGIELGYGSDLDLVFIHNCDSHGDTDGPKAIDSKQFYIKLAQRIMHLFTTKTASGDLYDIDLRLRPAGQSGLLVCHIGGFEEYQFNDAWTWEHQALTRSRFIFGDREVRDEFQRIRQAVLCCPRDWLTLREDVAGMREKMRRHLTRQGEGFDLKQDPGGIADIEFLVQYWVLQESHHHPKLCDYSDNVRLLETLAQSGVIDSDTATMLTEAYLAYRNAGHHYTLARLPSVDDQHRFDQQRQQVRRVWQQVFPDFMPDSAN